MRFSKVPADAIAELTGRESDVQLVIFDFDGVIADSELISLSTLRDSLGTSGVELSIDEVRRRCLGVSVAGIAKMVAEVNPAADLDSFREDWETHLFVRFRQELQPVPGLLTLLDRIGARGIPFCIASSGTHERIGIALEAMDISDRFAHVFSAEEVRNGKPAPDLFLHAAASMNVAPRHCLVIEDSAFGVAAATAARMPAIGFVGGGHLDPIRVAHAAELTQAGAATIVDSHAHLFLG